VIRRHVGAEALAAFRDGALRTRKASRTSAHLAACPRCAALSEDLAGVTAMLAGTRVPPMPEHLTARIQAALATEASNRVTLPSRAEPADSRGSRPRLPRFSGQLALRSLAGAAAVAVIAGGGYEIAQHAGSSPAASGSSSKSASVPARIAAPASGPALKYQHAGRAETIVPIATTTDYAARQLTRQVTTELAQHRAPVNSPGFRAGSPMSSVPAAQPAGVNNGQQSFANLSVTALQGCINRIAAGNLVLLVDVARYQGAPATVIVTRASAVGPQLVSVVGPGCSAARSDLLAHATLPAGG
jgi:anti-sigma factor RsiW